MFGGCGEASKARGFFSVVNHLNLPEIHRNIYSFLFFLFKLDIPPKMNINAGSAAQLVLQRKEKSLLYLRMFFIILIISEIIIFWNFCIFMKSSIFLCYCWTPHVY